MEAQMKCLFWASIVAVLASVPAFTQTHRIEVTAYGGTPLNHTLQPAFCCTTAASFVSQQTDDAKYLMGLSAGVLLWDHIHVTFGATYMPVSFRSFGTTCCPLSHPVAPTHGTSWEFPLLGDYRWLKGAVSPFSGGGLVVWNRTSGHTNLSGESQFPAPVVNGGVEWSWDRFVIRPEFRYIHYAERDSSNQDVGRPSTQTQLLIGVGYRIGGTNPPSSR
jgi:hypothetical protein